MKTDAERRNPVAPVIDEPTGVYIGNILVFQPQVTNNSKVADNRQ